MARIQTNKYALLTRRSIGDAHKEERLPTLRRKTMCIAYLSNQGTFVYSVPKQIEHHAVNTTDGGMIRKRGAALRMHGTRSTAPRMPISEPKTTIEQFQDYVTQLLDVESHTERERSKSQEALVHAAKMAAVGRMVASVNHEVKRPLASMHLLIENAVDLIARGDTTSAVENLHMLLRATDQIAELSRQLEGFSRKAPVNKTAVLVQQAISEARSVVSPKIAIGGHVLQVCGDTHYVLADLDRLTLALVNILDNAMDATADCEDKRIDIDIERHDLSITIRVRDRGPGIAAEALDKLFEAFFTTKPAGKGLGLGLALSSEVISDMGGQLVVGNHPDGGAEFSIRLPVAATPQ
ncbi:MAG: sensor histidine kinase [Noviherbaspirillum sp.]